MANEMDFAPEPADEWELTFSNDEGRVFHRRGPPFERVRSVTTIASRPGTIFPRATVSDVRDFRNSVAADVEEAHGFQKDPRKVLLKALEVARQERLAHVLKAVIAAGAPSQPI